MKKVLGIILGLLMMTGGFYCIKAPGITFLGLILVFGITLIESAVGYVVIWSVIKKAGGKNGLLIVNAILAFIVGFALLTDYFAQYVAEGMMLTMVAVVMILIGIEQINFAIKIKKLNGNFVIFLLMLIIGFFMALAGVASLINPIVLEMTIGTLIGIDIMLMGINLMFNTFAD